MLLHMVKDVLWSNKLPEIGCYLTIKELYDVRKLVSFLWQWLSVLTNSS